MPTCEHTRQGRVCGETAGTEPTKLALDSRAAEAFLCDTHHEELAAVFEAFSSFAQVITVAEMLQWADDAGPLYERDTAGPSYKPHHVYTLLANGQEYRTEDLRKWLVAAGKTRATRGSIPEKDAKFWAAVMTREVQEQQRAQKHWRAHQRRRPHRQTD